MKNVKILFALLAVAIILIAYSNVTEASLISSGDPFTTGSWVQGFNESGVGTFNRILISATTDIFEYPGIDSFSASGWGPTYFDNNVVQATGTSLESLTFNIRFSGEKTDPLIFYFYAFNDATLRESATANWNGSGWSITGGAPAAPNVPIPAAAWLLGTGLVGLVTIRRAKKR